MIYLDTHVAVWLYSGKLHLFTEETKEILRENELLISPLVQLELQYLYEIERIKVEPEIIIADLGRRVGLSLCVKSFNDIVLEAQKLTWTRDPFDRLLVGHAKVDDSILISRDRDILANYTFAQW